MYERFLNESCVDDSCPKIAEEKIYGTRSDCNKYCGKGFITMRLLNLIILDMRNKTRPLDFLGVFCSVDQTYSVGYG